MFVYFLNFEEHFEMVGCVHNDISIVTEKHFVGYYF